MRLVNVHTGPLDNGHNGAGGHASVRVAPGAAADFNGDNPSVKGWIAAGLLMPEEAVLASRASALANAPSVAELTSLRAQLAEKEAVINDLRARDATRAAIVTQMEQKVAVMATELAAAKERLAAAEADLAQATAPSTAPASGSADAPTSAAGETAAAPSARVRRQG
jgi:hypothetical protein